jgi:hypothetical protein
MITETDRIAQAISLGETLWPELRGDRAKLLRRILETGIAGIEKQASQEKSSRLKRIDAVAGTLSDVWPTNWREELKNEWPE